MINTDKAIKSTTYFKQELHPLGASYFCLETLNHLCLSVFICVYPWSIVLFRFIASGLLLTANQEPERENGFPGVPAHVTISKGG
jgi:hypothetical protein